jgi:NAD(P)H-hydrate epimerase
LLPARPADAHKGTFGRVLIVAGSYGMSGAAALAGLGALRGGAGLVYIAAPRSVTPIIAAIEPSYLTITLPESQDGCLGRAAAGLVQPHAAQMSSVAVGPGLGQSRGVTRLVTSLYDELPQPLVVDADALNVLSLTPASFAAHAGPRVLTPHAGEFSRMIGRPIADVTARRENLAIEFAARHNVVVLLKGAGTVVTDGTRVYVNTTGNSGMATGGCGDVLTGLLAALLAQGLVPFEAAQLAAWMHGRAGDIAAAELSGPALIASDLPARLGRVWLEAAATTAATATEAVAG